MDYQGFLNNMQAWDSSLVEKDKKSTPQASRNNKNVGKANVDDKKAPKVMPVEPRQQTKFSPGVYSSSSAQYNFLKSYNTATHLPSGMVNEENPPTATSEKELGNEYFKKKDFRKAIDCYSRSIALSPTSVAFANRAMAYLKLKRYEEAENDCTDALDLDDRYVKAYLRRATARKELGKLKASIEDSEFAIRLEPNNQELKKLHNETKALYEKEIMSKISSSKDRPQEIKVVGDGDIRATNDKLISSTNRESPSTQVVTSASIKKKENGCAKSEIESVQQLAARAASRVVASASRYVKTPKSAYEFEVSWRALSDDPPLQARLLKSIPPSSFPQLFKSALSATVLVDIIRCVASFFQEDAELAIDILDNLTKVPRFSMVVMCFSSLDRTDITKLWDEMLGSQHTKSEHQEVLQKMRPKFCPLL